jgi:hypothetical protein
MEQWLAAGQMKMSWRRRPEHTEGDIIIARSTDISEPLCDNCRRIGILTSETDPESFVNTWEGLTVGELIASRSECCLCALVYMNLEASGPSAGMAGRTTVLRIVSPYGDTWTPDHAERVGALGIDLLPTNEDLQRSPVPGHNRARYRLRIVPGPGRA